MTLLECRNVRKEFGGIVALDGFEMTVGEDAITGLIGPNGAGKTTLFDIVSGVHAPDAGTVRFRGEDVTGRSPHRVCRSGIARTFQTPRPIRSLDVVENLRVARRFGADEPDADDRELRDVLDAVGLADRAEVSAEDLQLVERKRLDLARALATDPDLVLLDELMAGLNPTEKSGMIATIERLGEDFDASFLVVEHDLSAIRSLSDEIVAVNEGRHVTAGTPREVLENEAVQEAYIGT